MWGCGYVCVGGGGCMWSGSVCGGKCEVGGCVELGI